MEPAFHNEDRAPERHGRARARISEARRDTRPRDPGSGHGRGGRVARARQFPRSVPPFRASHAGEVSAFVRASSSRDSEPFARRASRARGAPDNAGGAGRARATTPSMKSSRPRRPSVGSFVFVAMALASLTASRPPASSGPASTSTAPPASSCSCASSSAETPPPPQGIPTASQNVHEPATCTRAVNRLCHRASARNWAGSGPMERHGSPAPVPDGPRCPTRARRARPGARARASCRAVRPRRGLVARPRPMGRHADRPRVRPSVRLIPDHARSPFADVV